MKQGAMHIGINVLHLLNETSIDFGRYLLKYLIFIID